MASCKTALDGLGQSGDEQFGEGVRKSQDGLPRTNFSVKAQNANFVFLCSSAAHGRQHDHVPLHELPAAVHGRKSQRADLCW